jgi:glyoxylase-like metal-dependent hydrolase (beta-lactamase superfamily II)
MDELGKDIFVETSYLGVNVGAIRTHRGVIAIDAPSFPRDARDWVLRLHRLSQFPIQFVILTDYLGDRILNARWFGAPAIAHQHTDTRLSSYDKRYAPSLSESLGARHPERGREFNSNYVVERPVISFSHKMALFRGPHEVQLIAAPGPTTGNIWVYLPETAVLFTGDTLVVDTHPLLSDGSCQQWLATLDQLEQFPHPLHAIVPGRGPVCATNAVTAVRHYLHQMQTRAAAHWQAGLTRDDMTNYVAEFMDYFPLGQLPLDWVKRHIKQSLERVYDEIKLTAMESGRSG